ncbi:MAG: hypothetical protein PHW73_04830 [Atribacterota bacterium]|nr:hypothetical protein [Atribacterota bacterium]
MVVSDSTYKRQKSEGRNFLKFSKLTVRDFPNLNSNATALDMLLIKYADNVRSKSKKKISSAYYAGLIRLVNTGIKRLFVESRNGGVRCDLDYEDLLKEVIKFLGEGLSYNEVISQDQYPSPLEIFENVEVVEGQKYKDCAFIGHYIKVDMKTSEFLQVLGKDEFNFEFLGNLLSEFFNNAQFFTEDFLNSGYFRIAFRVCFLGETYTSDDSNDSDENQYIRIKFSDSMGALISKLKDFIKKRKENYKNIQKDPIINWILPIYPMYDSQNFSRDEGNRLGFYMWYRGNLIDF